MTLLLLFTSCLRPKPLAVMGSVPEFQLTSQAGQPFDSKSLDGHIWVADFIYTTCTGPCPTMSLQMRQIQTFTASTPDVLLLSFTVDPAHDTPEALAAYAKHFRYDPNRWFFLTGDAKSLDELGVNGFHLNSVDGSLTHSTRFVLVDRRRRIRGYYVIGLDGFMQQLIHDIRQLQQENS